MEDIPSVVAKIVESAKAEACLDVKPALAAFVARTVVLEAPEEFPPDQQLTERDVVALVKRCVARLAEADSPQMETLRMQVEFESVFKATEEHLAAKAAEVAGRIAALKNAVVSIEANGGSEFELINNVYRQVYQLLVFATCDGQEADLAVEREVAAALESVFPKIGVKAFRSLDHEVQKQQMDELISIVKGIRVFNWHLGKGGVGLEDTAELVRRSADQLLTNVRVEHKAAESLRKDFESVLVYVHRLPAGERPPVADMQRWRQELCNRQQYLAFLSSLEEEAKQSLELIGKMDDELVDVLESLTSLVKMRASVPKDQVYPKFDLVAEIRAEMDAELKLIRSRHQVLAALQAFSSSCSFTLDPKLVGLADSSEPARDDFGDVLSEASEAPETKFEGDEEEEGKEAEDESKGSDRSSGERRSKKSGGGGHGSEGKSAGGDDRPKLIEPRDSTEFMSLPLQFQGFCPVTVARRNGLLLAGDPNLGVVQWRGTHQVFYSEEAMAVFLAAPERIMSELLSVTRAQPELIQLLELHEHFPETAMQSSMSMARGLRGAGRQQGGQGGQYGAKSAKVDAATETPTHFVEKHIDPSYEWNEWALRRRALQLVNLRNARTSSTQTVKSHFRRENESQVYLPRESGTQTGLSKATNPPRQHQYVVGLRGLASSKFVRYRDGSGAQVSAAEVQSAARSAANSGGPRSTVVNLTLEL